MCEPRHSAKRRVWEHHYRLNREFGFVEAARSFGEIARPLQRVLAAGEDTDNQREE
jgi:hypothetical protein